MLTETIQQGNGRSEIFYGQWHEGSRKKEPESLEDLTWPMVKTSSHKLLIQIESSTRLAPRLSKGHPSSDREMRKGDSSRLIYPVNKGFPWDCT